MSAGHRASLLAPAAAAAALVGPAEVAEALPWDGPEMAAVLAGETTGGPVERALASADAVVAFTRSASVLEALGRRARRLLARDPAPSGGGPHASHWLAGALAPLGIDTSAAPPALVFTEAEAIDAAAATSGLPAGFLAVHPGSGSPAKNWPFGRFAEAARRLTHGQRWLLVLGPAEDDFVPRPAEERGLLGSSKNDLAVSDGPSAGASLRNAVVARGLPLRRLAAMLARAGLFLGNDSGVSHLAAACGTRTFALFGPTDPAQWAPVGSAVRTLRASTGRMEDIEVDDVVARCGSETSRSD